MRHALYVPVTNRRRFAYAAIFAMLVAVALAIWTRPVHASTASTDPPKPKPATVQVASAGGICFVPTSGIKVVKVP